MAVRSSTFGGVSLTGEDARAFLRQVEQSEPSKEAVAALKRGKKMVQEYKEQGFVRIYIKNR